MTEPTTEVNVNVDNPSNPSSGAPQEEPPTPPPGQAPEDQETGNTDTNQSGSIQGADPEAARQVSGEEQQDQPAATEQPSVTPADSGVSEPPAT